MCLLLTQNYNRGTIPLTCIIIDTFSNDRVTNNLEIIEILRICTEDEKIIILNNGGSKDYYYIGSINIFPVGVHFNPESMARCEIPSRFEDYH